MEKIIKKELNNLGIDSELIENFLENILEALNENGIKDFLNTIKSFNSSVSKKIIIEAIINETPEVLRIIPQSQYLEWIKQCYRISEVSEDISLTYINSTTSVIENLKPRHLLDWGNTGLSLYRSSKNSVSLVNNFYKFSPSLSKKLSFEEIEILSDTLKRISARSISFSIKILDWVLKISSKSPNDLIVWNKIIFLVSKKLIKDFEEIFTILAENADSLNENKIFMKTLPSIIDENPQIFKSFIPHIKLRLDIFKN